MKKIEERYLVVKLSDIKRAVNSGDISNDESLILTSIASRVNNSRCRFNNPLKALVIEEPWPEYPIVLEALESRINDLPAAMVFSRAKGKDRLAAMVGYTSYLERDPETGKLVNLRIDEYKYVHQPRFHLGGIAKDIKLTLSPSEVPGIVSPSSMGNLSENAHDVLADITLNFSGVVSHDQACTKALKNISTRDADPDIKVFKWHNAGMEKWFEHTHCINWLSACPKCKTTAARVKSSSMDSNHLLDNDTVECACCGNTGHIEIFNSDADVAWDVADGE